MSSRFNRRLDRLERGRVPDQPGFVGSPRWWGLLGGTLNPADLTGDERLALAAAVPPNVPDEVEAEIASLHGATAADDLTIVTTNTTPPTNREDHR